MSEAGFTLDELMAFLRQQGVGTEAGDERYRTRTEWAELFDIAPNKMLDLIHAAGEAGILLVDRQNRPRIDGVIQRVSVYAFDIDTGEEEAKLDEKTGH